MSPESYAKLVACAVREVTFEQQLDTTLPTDTADARLLMRTTSNTCGAALSLGPLASPILQLHPLVHLHRQQRFMKQRFMGNDQLFADGHTSDASYTSDASSSALRYDSPVVRQCEPHQGADGTRASACHHSYGSALAERLSLCTVISSAA